MEIEKLFQYKGLNIYIKKDKKFYVGIGKPNKDIIIWLDNISYDTLELAVNSGREYARSVINKTIYDKKS